MEGLKPKGDYTPLQLATEIALKSSQLIIKNVRGVVGTPSALWDGKMVRILGTQSGSSSEC